MTLADAIARHVPIKVLTELAAADPNIAEQFGGEGTSILTLADALALANALLRGLIASQSLPAGHETVAPVPTEGDRMLANTRVTSRDLEQWFTYHSPTPEQVELIKRLRQAGGAFAQIVKRSTPGCEDQRQAIQHVRMAVMLANASLVCGVR